MTSTATPSPAPAAKAAAATRSVPMARLVRVELRKMIDTRAGLWLFIAMALLTAGAVVLFLVFADAAELTFIDLLGITLTPQGFLLPVLGILLITSEWTQRTGLVTFTLEPNRGRVVIAKVAAALIVGLYAVVLAVAVAAVGNVLAGTVFNGDGAWNLEGTGAVSILVLQVSAIVQGLAFGMLLMNSAAAIVTYFVLPIAFSIVFTLVEALNDVAEWIDIGTAQTPLFDPDLNGGLTSEEWTQLAVASTIWIVLPLVAGVIRLMRSEFKSA